MKAIKDILIAKAKKQFEEIFPLFSHTDFEDAFTVEGNKLIFWFLTGDKSSHVIIADIDSTMSAAPNAIAADFSSSSSAMRSSVTQLYIPDDSRHMHSLFMDNL